MQNKTCRENLPKYEYSVVLGNWGVSGTENIFDDFFARYIDSCHECDLLLPNTIFALGFIMLQTTCNNPRKIDKLMQTATVQQ